MQAFAPADVDLYTGIAGPLLVVDDGTGCGALTECDFNGLFEATITSDNPLISAQITVKPSAAQVSAAAQFNLVVQAPAVGVSERTLIWFVMVWDGVGFVARFAVGQHQITMPTSYRSTTEEVTFKVIHDADNAATKTDIWAVDHPSGNSSALTEGQPILNAGTGYFPTTCGHCVIGAAATTGQLDMADPDNYQSKAEGDTIFNDFYYDNTAYLNDATSMTEGASVHYWSLGTNPILSTGTTGGQLIVTPNCVIPDFRS